MRGFAANVYVLLFLFHTFQSLMKRSFSKKGVKASQASLLTTARAFVNSISVERSD